MKWVCDYKIVLQVERRYASPSQWIHPYICPYRKVTPRKTSHLIWSNIASYPRGLNHDSIHYFHSRCRRYRIHCHTGVEHIRTIHAVNWVPLNVARHYSCVGDEVAVAGCVADFWGVVADRVADHPLRPRPCKSRSAGRRCGKAAKFTPRLGRLYWCSCSDIYH